MRSPKWEGHPCPSSSPLSMKGAGMPLPLCDSPARIHTRRAEFQTESEPRDRLLFLMRRLPPTLLMALACMALASCAMEQKRLPYTTVLPRTGMQDNISEYRVEGN